MSNKNITNIFKILIQETNKKIDEATDTKQKN